MVECASGIWAFDEAICWVFGPWNARGRDCGLCSCSAGHEDLWGGFCGYYVDAIRDYCLNCDSDLEFDTAERRRQFKNKKPLQHSTSASRNRTSYEI